LNEEEAMAIARAYIEKEHSLGESTGGSGHLGYTSLRGLTVKDVQQRVVDGAVCWKIDYQYTLVTETEFTYYPDNPPQSSAYTKEIIVDAEGRIVEYPHKE
jgi:hypothetical protein